jgi:GH25 family lysozyme M1 (1,4-beta-N-acetylmuramidase)
MTTPKLQFLDLSHYSWPVDWDMLAQNPDLIAIGWKASQGTGMGDRYFDVARHEITSRGYLFLAYHFGDKTDPHAQVENFLRVAQPDDKMRLALDWEDNPRGQMEVQGAIDFLEACDEITGRFITCYSGNTARDLLGARRVPALGKHPLWIPRYSLHEPMVQPSWPRWDIWQYAADGFGPQPNSAKGVRGHPDCNVFAQPPDVVKATWAGLAPTGLPVA